MPVEHRRYIRRRKEMRSLVGLAVSIGILLTARAPIESPAATSGTVVPIRISSPEDHLPRVIAFSDAGRVRAAVGSFSLTSRPGSGGTTGGSAADGLPNLGFGEIEWGVKPGDVTFRVDAATDISSADINVCLDRRCSASVAGTHLDLSSETSWTTELAEGLYVLHIGLRFDRGDAEYFWTFEVDEDADG